MSTLTTKLRTKLATQKQMALALNPPEAFQVQIVCKYMRGSTCTYHRFQALSNILVEQVLHQPFEPFR